MTIGWEWRLTQEYPIQLFFESFPLVFGNIYGFNLGEQGLAFLGEFRAMTLCGLPLINPLHNSKATW